MDSYQSAKEEIKRAADIVELIGQYVQLKRAGLNHMGLCPFHSEKAPSFTVNRTKQMFHCFGCKKGGDIFKFWMEYHNVSFPQAMKDLAARYNIEFMEKKLTPVQRQKVELKEVLFNINEDAAEYYHHILLKSDKGRDGRKYLDKRKLNQEVINQFLLGYAPDDWSGLTGFLKSRKINLDKAAQAGLIIPKKTNGYYDRFRGRIIFPIYNSGNRIAGFGGRVLDDSLPKYLNTPETPVFFKGELFYGLHAAYQHIRANGRALIVEGYTDVLALQKHGLKEAIATLGTALTRNHIRKLKGYTKEAIVVFDADTAGKGAVIKSLPLFLNEGLSSRVIALPEGEDPDTFVNRNGKDSFIKLLDNAIPLFEFYLDQKLSQLDDGVDGQWSLLKETLPILAELNDESQRLLYLRKLSEKSGISESVALSELRGLKIKQSRPGQKRLREMLSVSRARKGDDLPLLNLMVHSPGLIPRLIKNDCRLLLSDPAIIEIFDSICEISGGNEEITQEKVLAWLKQESAREKFREVMISPRIYPDDLVEQAVIEFENRINKIKITKSIKKAREQGNLEELNQLLKLKQDEQGSGLK